MSRPTVGRAAIVLAVLMVATRVYAGAHYPSDVIAGLLISAVVAAVGAPLIGPTLGKLRDGAHPRCNPGAHG